MNGSQELSLTRTLQGNCGMLLWAAGSSSPAQMMDVMGLCEGGSQMLVAFLGLAFSAGKPWKVFHANQERVRGTTPALKVLNVTDLWVAALGFLPAVGKAEKARG